MAVAFDAASPDAAPAAPPKAPAIDTGLESLCLLASILGERLDPARIRHEHLSIGAPATGDDLLRIARSEGFKSRRGRSSAKRLGRLPLPAIGVDREGAFFVIARSDGERVLIARPRQPVANLAADELAGIWSGEVIYVAKREALGGDALRFSLAWFLPVVKRFKRVLAEVLIVSAFIQLVGLITPLFTQVVIDKVLVHRGLTTLEVLVIALLAANLAEVALGWLRTYAFSHTTSRMDAILGLCCSGISSPCRSPISRRRPPARRWRACASSRTSASSSRARRSPSYRRRLRQHLPRGDVCLQPVPDLGRGDLDPFYAAISLGILPGLSGG